MPPRKKKTVKPNPLGFLPNVPKPFKQYENQYFTMYGSWWDDAPSREQKEKFKMKVIEVDQSRCTGSSSSSAAPSPSKKIFKIGSKPRLLSLISLIRCFCTEDIASMWWWCWMFGWSCPRDASSRIWPKQKWYLLVVVMKVITKSSLRCCFGHNLRWKPGFLFKVASTQQFFTKLPVSASSAIRDAFWLIHVIGSRTCV